MARKCTVCEHPQREVVDGALLRNVPYRELTGQFGLSKSALHRHRQHLSEHLLKAKEADEALTAGKLLADLADLQSRALALLDRAEKQDIRAAIACLREAREVVSAMARILETSELEKRLTELEQRLELGNTIT